MIEEEFEVLNYRLQSRAEVSGSDRTAVTLLPPAGITVLRHRP